MYQNKNKRRVTELAKLTGVPQVDVIALKGRNLDSVCYRGYAPLAHLAIISSADVFDQVNNPNGLQRDLSPKHAAEAYEYIKKSMNNDEPDYKHAFPEVVLNVRNKEYIKIEKITDGQEFELDGLNVVKLRFDVDSIKNKKSKKVAISRVDGNHRLYYAEGDEGKRDPLLAMVPFQIHVGLTTEQERSLFVDINANQKGLNSSHLAIMHGMLTDEQIEMRDHLDRWMAKKLTNDHESPWHGIVHLGGSKTGSKQQGLNRTVNFVSLQTGVNRTLKKSQYIYDLTSVEAQYLLIRNYWQAVKKVFSQEWASKDYLVTKNIGVLSLSILGGTIIDRCITRGTVNVDDIVSYLKQAYVRFDWSKVATGERAVVGKSGNQAALIIAGEMASELTDTNGDNLMRDLEDSLLNQNSTD